MSQKENRIRGDGERRGEDNRYQYANEITTKDQKERKCKMEGGIYMIVRETTQHRIANQKQLQGRENLASPSKYQEEQTQLGLEL